MEFNSGFKGLISNICPQLIFILIARTFYIGFAWFRSHSSS